MDSAWFSGCWEAGSGVAGSEARWGHGFKEGIESGAVDRGSGTTLLPWLEPSWRMAMVTMLRVKQVSTLNPGQARRQEGVFRACLFH